MNDMKNIKEILSDFEVPYDHNDWVKLEKSLPKSPGMSGFTKTILVASALIVAVSGVYLLTLNKEKIDNPQKTNNSNPQAVVSEVNSDISTSDINNNTNSNINYSSANNIDPLANNTIETGDVQTNDNTAKLITDVSNNDTENSTQINTTEKTNNTSTNVVNSIPNVEKCSFKVQIIDNCIPAKVKFIAENIPDGCEVIWSTDENLRLYGKTAEHTYLEADNFEPSVKVVYNNQDIKTEKLGTITINQPSLVKINFDNSENSYYFTCNITDEIDYLWSIDNQQFNEKEITYVFEKSGEHSVKLVAVNEFGCKSEAFEKINIVIEHVYFIPNAFIPNSNGVNSSFGPIGENMDFESYQLVIVDGNGTTVFTSDKPQFMWNGRINNIGDEARAGFYLWEIKTLDKFGNLQTKKGRVNLIRN